MTELELIAKLSRVLKGLIFYVPHSDNPFAIAVFKELVEELKDVDDFLISAGFTKDVAPASINECPPTHPDSPQPFTS